MVSSSFIGVRVWICGMRKLSKRVIDVFSQALMIADFVEKCE